MGVSFIQSLCDQTRLPGERGGHISACSDTTKPHAMEGGRVCGRGQNPSRVANPSLVQSPEGNHMVEKPRRPPA